MDSIAGTATAADDAGAMTRVFQTFMFWQTKNLKIYLRNASASHATKPQNVGSMLIVNKDLLKILFKLLKLCLFSPL